MNKLFYITIPLLLSTVCVARSQVRKDTPAVTSENRLLPRGDIFPYVSRDAALMGGDGASEYVVPLTDWNVSDVENGVRFTTRFKVPFKWFDRLVILRVEGAGGAYDVEINGQDGGYTSNGMARSEFDLTKKSVENYNDLSVTVYDDYAAKVLENGHSAAKASIGKAYIISQPKVRVRDFVIDADVNGTNGTLTLGVLMDSHLLNGKEYTVHFELVDPAGVTVASSRKAFSTGMLTSDNVIFAANVPNVLQWNHETPYLYTAIIRTQYEGVYKEYVPLKVGFTDFAYNNGRFTVSGGDVDLVQRQAKYEGSYERTFDSLRQLKSQGVTMVVSAGPQPDDFYKACDRVGMYVCDVADVDTSRGGAITKGGNPSNNPVWTASFVDRAETMYRMSKNHPSVVAFSPAAGGSRNGICLYESYLTLKSLEPSRPVYYSSAAGQWNSDNIVFADRAAKTSLGVKISASDADLANRQVTVRNLSAITPFMGEVTVSLKKRGLVKKKITQDLILEPAQTITLPFDADDVNSGVDNLIVRVTYTNGPFDYVLVQPSQERQSDAGKRKSVAELLSGDKKTSTNEMFIEESFVLPK